ncbi:DUF7260 family protein [Halalkalirubrum salinum]|uniref:DUF7260 family protein n=1 Tax=Halalkalirubrum salinum TaxID=2563889 RepID=UPI0010FB30B5|nr:hypothetical protein [Halalkalirubrum salinum]
MNRTLRSAAAAIKRPLLFLGWAVVLSVLFPKVAPSWVFHMLPGVVSINHAIGESIRREGVAAVLAFLGYLREVRTAIENERQTLAVERDAFEAFADGVTSIPVAGQPIPAGSALRSGENAGKKRLKQVRDRYRETVMSVSHYDEEYGENLFEHMSEELSPEAAIAVVDGAGLSAHLKEVLIIQARLAAHSRQELLETIDAERQSVRSVISSLQSSDSVLDETEDESLRERSFSELMAAEQELSQTMNAVDETIQDRQADIQQVERRSPAVDRSTFHRYLYRGLEPTFPVLDTLLDRYETIRDRRRAVIRAITRR